MNGMKHSIIFKEINGVIYIFHGKRIIFHQKMYPLENVKTNSILKKLSNRNLYYLYIYMIAERYGLVPPIKVSRITKKG